MGTLIKRRYTATVLQSFAAAVHSGANSSLSQPHMAAGACIGRIAANATALADRTCQDSRPSTSASHAPLNAPPDTHNSEEEPARVFRVHDSARLDGRPSISSSHAPPTSSSCRAAAPKVRLCLESPRRTRRKQRLAQDATKTGSVACACVRACARAHTRAASSACDTLKHM
jgi:hypothetical protein